MPANSNPSPAPTSTTTSHAGGLMASSSHKTNGRATFAMLRVGSVTECRVCDAQVHVPVDAIAPLQVPLAQSVAVAHVWPPAHFAHAAPQSASLSKPSRTPSVQLGGPQLPALHAALWQSAGMLQ